MEAEAERLGAELTVLDAGILTTPVLAEVLYQRMRPALVVGCFSTALLTASALYGLPVARVGTEMLLDRLSPYENSNRMPVTLVDALLPELTDRPSVEAQRPSAGTEPDVRPWSGPSATPCSRAYTRVCGPTRSVTSPPGWTRRPGGTSSGDGSPRWGCRAECPPSSPSSPERGGAPGGAPGAAAAAGRPEVARAPP